jgi:putative lipoic acid-binding regulatory protein
MADHVSQANDQTPEAPRIVFPCDYPIKVLGEHAEGFVDLVVDIVRRHDPELREELIRFRASAEGRWLSVQLLITATGPEQLSALFAELKATGRVAMVL